jgi:hypothetical protein
MRQVALSVALFCFAAAPSVKSLCQTIVPHLDRNAPQMGQRSLQDNPNVNQLARSSGVPVTVTGILLVSDSRCDERPPEAPQNKWECPEGFHQWGLRTEKRQYAVQGVTSDLKQFERRRVIVTGIATPGTEIAPIDNLQVQSIADSEVEEDKIQGFIDELRSNRWIGPQNMGSPTMWLFHPTPPMIGILQAGPVAQDDLLGNLNDPQIKDQIIFLLGGVGDGRAIKPIIDAMAGPDEAQVSDDVRKVNLAANLALTNLTVGDVIWHRGGGVTLDRCPNDPKSCWSAWWAKNSRTFDISHTASRLYSNYPGYGIYQDSHTFRSEDFPPAH